MKTAEKPTLGDKVTCKTAQHAFYSGYGIKPTLVFRPGMVGKVVSVAPKVCKIKGPGFDGEDDFLVVDYLAPETRRTERVGLNYANIVRIG